MTHATDPQCYANHMGPWLLEPIWMANAKRAIVSGVWQPRAATSEDEARERRRLNVSSGVSVVPLDGVLMKGWSKFGGTSTLDARRMLREAVASSQVNAIMLSIDSPGGTVAGTQELAHEIRRAAEQKPVVAHISDMGASAAYWAASQAVRVTANETAQVGSIGVVAVVEDSSKAAELEGIQVHVIATGKLKGAGTPGTEITEEMLERWQSLVDSVGRVMTAEIASGRGVSRKRILESSDGETFIASDAQERGLIDGVMDFDEAFAMAVRDGEKWARANRDRRQRAMARERAIADF